MKISVTTGIKIKDGNEQGQKRRSGCETFITVNHSQPDRSDCTPSQTSNDTRFNENYYILALLTYHNLFHNVCKAVLDFQIEILSELKDRYPS